MKIGKIGFVFATITILFMFIFAVLTKMPLYVHVLMSCCFLVYYAYESRLKTTHNKDK